MNAGKSQTNKLSLVATAVIVLIAISLSNSLLSGLRLDLTENKLYTLTDGSRQILESIEEPVNLYFYYSADAAKDLPFLGSYATRIEELLQEFKQNAQGNLNVMVIDPEPFSEDEDRATGFGLQGFNLSAGSDAVFLGLAGTNAVGDEAIIPVFDPNKEPFLEYDLAKLIYELANPDKPVVALLSTLPVRGTFDPRTQQMQPDWVFIEQLQQLYQVRHLQPDVQSLDQDIDALVLIHPKQLSIEMQYAIDQFVLRGGRLILFADPWSDAEGGANPAQMPPGAASSAASMNRLLTSWGISIPDGEIIGDSTYALQVQSPSGVPVRHLALIGLRDASIDKTDIITAGLESINAGYVGHITAVENASTTLTPLLSSSNQAAILPNEMLMLAQQDPTLLQQGFQPTGENYVLAARVSGPVNSAFAAAPDGVANATDHLSESTTPINIIVVADTDLLSDRFWVQLQNFFGQRLVTAFASNGDFIGNAVDNIVGSEALIGMRGRASFSRPFTRVEDLARHAEDEYQLREQMLQQELTETESRLGQLQADEGDNGVLILSAEQQAEIERFRDEGIQIRKELRVVQRDLRSNIEGLGTALKVINIALIPFLFTLIAIGGSLWRRKRATA
jgi:ABC-type uncharacterized transport system involved in gliding motility auxiliary subunit